MSGLGDWGWDDGWEAAWAEARAGDRAEAAEAARVVADGRVLEVRTAAGPAEAVVSGRIHHRAAEGAARPAVGDWVALDAAAAGDAGPRRIVHVLPRRSKFSRKAAGERTDEQVVAANVDVVWVVTAMDADFSERRLERYLTLVWDSGARPRIVLTKADVADRADAGSGGTGGVERYRAAAESVAMGAPVEAVSNKSGAGLAELERSLEPGRTVALLGSSGVGKSTLINRLAGAEVARTAAVRESDSTGRHTTTRRQLLRLASGALLIDTPGMREIQLWDAGEGLSGAFADVEEHAAGCRFRDCGHEEEPGCAVRAAVEAGALPAERLESFRALRAELARLERKQDVHARQEEARRWKTIHKSLRAHPKYRNKR